MALTDAVGRIVRSPAFKFFLILLLIILLLVPLLLVNALIWDREQRAAGVREEVGRLWGPTQRVLGPFLVVPYTVRVFVGDGDRRVERIDERYAIFTPTALEVSGRTETTTLRRSIFEVPVYTANLKLFGSFATPRIEDVASETASVRWRDAKLVLAISGVAGLKEASALKIDGATDVPLAPSLGFKSGNLTGVHARLAGAGPAVVPQPPGPLRPFTFTLELALKGSVALTVAPVARETRLALRSDWPHPSFTGAFLPDTREVTSAGFTAAWKIPHLARSVPEAWSTSEATLQRLEPYAFGVSMIAPVDFYSLVNRAAKYGIMFVAMAFMAVFCLELVAARPVHAVQYLFTGIALVFFYVLLLSLAEHLGFTMAYVLASLATGAMLAAYVGYAMASAARGFAMLAVFAVIYGMLYLILQLEDYALLAGAILGFVALAVVMFTTRRVDWSGGTATRPPAPA